MSIAENLDSIRRTLPEGVKLVAVSKTKSAGEIMEAYHAGQRLFGENKVQELVAKRQELPQDIEWHFIGHLQSNKVKYLAPFVSMIHGVESASLLSVIDREAGKCGRIIPVLLQFHIASEETKFGLSPEEAEEMLSADSFAGFANVVVAGVMGMATFTSDEAVIRSEFRQLKMIFEHLKQKYFHQSNAFREISMGMSDDFPIAVEEGSTMVRIGSRIFGLRPVCRAESD